MTAEGVGRLVILSGPSCVGKSPLAKALARFHPDLSAKLQPIVLHNSRAPRPGEPDGEDYHFRSREQIETLRDRERYLVMDVRGDLQALDLEDLSALLMRGEAFFEGNPFIGRTLQTHPKLQHVPARRANLSVDSLRLVGRRGSDRRDRYSRFWRFWLRQGLMAWSRTLSHAARPSGN
jgi:Guanylate kinase